MKLLVDEGVDFSVVQRLRDRGYDVASVLKEQSGATDDEVLAWAVAQNRLLVTNDKDFGELVYRQRYDVSGILLLRLIGRSPEAKADLVGDLLDDRGAAVGEYIHRHRPR